MIKKILYCASTVTHIQSFHLPYLQLFKEIGWQVDVVVESKVDIPFADNVIEVPFEKSLFSVNNVHAISDLKLILTKTSYDVVSIHTTLAGAIVRIALQLIKNPNTKVIYTSHGYFFSGEGNFVKWPYLFVEKLLSPSTDVLMVMNDEDYHLANRHNLCKEIIFIPGMGSDISKFSYKRSDVKENLKKLAGYNSDDFLIVYVAEMSKRKNQKELIKAFSLAALQEPSLKLIFAGEGSLKDEYMNLANKSGFGDRINFLGHVKNIDNLYGMCDLVVSTSISEGLPFNIIEAMACGLPIIASRIKGHIDLLGSLKEDCLYELGNEEDLSNRLISCYLDDGRRMQIGEENLVNVERYSLKSVKPQIIEAYSRYF